MTTETKLTSRSSLRFALQEPLEKQPTRKPLHNALSLVNLTKRVMST